MRMPLPFTHGGDIPWSNDTYGSLETFESVVVMRGRLKRHDELDGKEYNPNVQSHVLSHRAMMTANLSSKRPDVFVGRKAELEEVRKRLLSPECQLLTVIGLGGSGKTRLAVEAARDLANHFQDGIVLVGLQQLSRSDLLVQTIAQALSLTFYGEDETETQLFKYLSDKSMLLLLDNFEHLLASAPILSEILAYAPMVKILVTSREALNVQEEWLYPLKGMNIPLSTYATSWQDYDAVQLLLYHARRVQPAFDPDQEHDSISRICAMTAGLPLAIELAASWLKGLTGTQVAAAMQNNLDFLSTTARNTEERHRSMRAVFEQSWKLLSEDEQRVFARLSIFLGGFDSAAANQVAEAPFSVLAGLAEKSMVQVVSSDRFAIHEMLRQFGLEKLAAFGETEATYTHFSGYFSQRMAQQEAALKELDQMEIMRSIERDFDNVRLAWEWAIEKQLGNHLHTMLNSLYLFGLLGGRNVEVLLMFQQHLEQIAFDRPLYGRMLVRRWGFLHWWWRQDFDEALANIEQAMTIAQAEDNPFEIAFCHLIAAYALIGKSRFTEAVSHLETGQALFEQLDEPYYVCWVLHRLGVAYGFLNEREKEVAYTEQSLMLARQTHNRFALFICLFYLGADHFLRGNFMKGKRYGTEALDFAVATGHQCQIAHAEGLIALCAFYEGDYSTCLASAERSRSVVRDVLPLIIEPYSLSLLVLLACLREDYDEAVRLTELGNQHPPNLLGFQLSYWAFAVLECGLGDPKEARIYLQKMIDLSDAEEYSALIFGMVPCTAYVLADTRPEKAVELISWVHAYPETSLDWARQWPLFDRLQSQLQASLDTQSFQTHWDIGKTVSFEAMDLFIQNEFHTSNGVVIEGLDQKLLTARESEILHLIAAGMTNPQIAAALVIGVGTVKTHTLNIYRKLEVTNRTQATVRAQELGVLDI
ncbi:MAG: hypothetical protein KJ065_19710 [Anaerolineae bacterium]|nr:hypothetical protein [Anaerolineae bacterium]